MNNKTNGIHVGGTSIIMVFTLLFFAMFGSLSLSSTHVSLRQSEKARDHVVSYYDADVAAVKDIAKLTADGITAAGGTVEIIKRIGDSGRQELTITVSVRDGKIHIDEYRVRSTGGSGLISIDDSFNYFQGEYDWG